MGGGETQRLKACLDASLAGGSLAEVLCSMRDIHFKDM